MYDYDYYDFAPFFSLSFHMILDIVNEISLDKVQKKNRYVCNYGSSSFKSWFSVDSLCNNVIGNSYARDFPPVSSFLDPSCAHVLMVLRAVNIYLINITSGAQLQTFKESERSWC